MRDQLFEAFGNNIVRGYAPNDAAFGSTAWSIDFETKYAQGTGVIDQQSDEILALFIRDSLGRGHRYAWINPSIKNYVNELYSITDSVDDIFEKALALLGNRRFDPRVIMQFDLDNETINTLETLAVSRNETLDETIEFVLKTAIEAADGEA